MVITRALRSSSHLKASLQELLIEGCVYAAVAVGPHHFVQVAQPEEQDLRGNAHEHMSEAQNICLCCVRL
jgi:hypothetical protein